MPTFCFRGHPISRAAVFVLTVMLAARAAFTAEEPGSAAQAEGYPRVVTVRVMDKDTREPLAGAKLTVRIDDEERVLSTDEAGVCEVELSAPPESWVVFDATHRGYVRDWVAGEPEKLLRTNRPHTIRLEKGIPISGVIVDESGTPVEGVRVTFSLQIRNIHVETVTDAAGRWELGVPVGEVRPAWQVQHPDFALSPVFQWIDITDELRKGRHRHVIERGESVAGVIVDEAGAPVAGAFVLRGHADFDSYETLRENIESGETRNAVVSGADGTFAIPVETGIESVAVCAEGFAPTVLEVSGDATAHRVVLGKGGAWAGRVVDALGNGIEGASVRCYQWNGRRDDSLMMRPYAAKTDAEGKFAMPFLPTSGVLEMSVGKTSFFGLHLTPAELADLPMELTLHPSAPLHGRVYDAETKAPVKSFTVDYGFSEAAQPVSTYHCHDPILQSSKDGTFSIDTGLSLGEKPGALWVRVWSFDHYPTFIDPVWALDLAKGPLEIALEPAPGISGRLLAPGGEGARGATVAFVHADERAVIEAYQLGMNYVGAPYNHATSRTGGRFTLAPSREPGYILALHESGWAVRPTGEFNPGDDLPLLAWCTLEGRVSMEGRTEGENARVNVVLPIQKQWGDKEPVRFQCYTTADKDGRFRIEHVPAVPLQVGESRRWLMSHPTSITPQPGETVQVELGDPKGGAVCGRIVVDTLADPEGDFPEPWHADRRFLIAARPAGAEADDENANYVPFLLEDGTFRLTDLPPGEYELTATAHEQPPENACGRGTPRARAVRVFIVAEGMSEPLDLGQVQLERVVTAGVGDAAPDIEATALDGDVKWRLTDELQEGKPVLLVFWATWCAPCKAEIPLLKEVWETYGNGDRLRVVGINLDWDKQRVTRFVEQEGVPWPQYNADAWGESNPVINAYGVSYIPSNWLVGADGKVLASNIPADALRETLEQHVPAP